jgi:predicted RecB family nuclease
MGNAVGDFLEKALREAYGDRIRFEVPVVSDEFDFAGNIDALLQLESGKVVVLEFKSIKHQGFIRLKEPKPEHAIQVASYARLIGAQDIEAWVVYVDKENYDILEFQVDVPSWADRARRILNVLDYYGDRKPPRLPEADTRKWPCGWCNWRTECLGGTNG